MTDIAFSYDIFVAQQTGGVTRCMLEMMRELPGDWQLWSPVAANQMLIEVAHEPWLATRWHRPSAFLGGRVLGGLQLEPAFASWVRRSEASVVHRTYYPIIDLAPKRSKRVVTLHDMWDERSEASKDRSALIRSRIKQRACEGADRIICVSQHTQKEMTMFWPWLVDKTVVIPHGVRTMGKGVEPPQADPFFLFVGRRGLYKNFSVAVAALALAALPKYRLVCFGGGTFTPEERALIALNGLDGRVIQVDGNDAELAGYYESAVALLYPSSYEGFGLPLLEAMTHDCPVIASPLTSLPEVGGDAVLFADPADPAAWSEALWTIAMNGAAADELRRAGQRRAACFSWARSAEAHQCVYDQLT